MSLSGLISLIWPYKISALLLTGTGTRTSFEFECSRSFRDVEWCAAAATGVRQAVGIEGHALLPTRLLPLCLRISSHAPPRKAALVFPPFCPKAKDALQRAATSPTPTVIARITSSLVTGPVYEAAALGGKPSIDGLVKVVGALGERIDQCT
ncbi:hypothetical protein HD554DRAFT_2040917 [Boletus coccyginus]|nr:hypothetical protein HD554DRAFT_2040917 [Boletus coccyginus]